MGYYAAGDYYMAGDVDWGNVLQTVGNVAQLIPHPAAQAVGIAARVGGGLLGGGPPMPGGSMVGAPAGATVTRLPRAARGGGGHYRRMNPGNFRALRRSMRRLKSFEKAARAVYRFTHHKAAGGHFVHRKRRK